MAYGTVAEMIAGVRILLQDTVQPYRYADADLVMGLNAALLEARRLRPDLFLTTPNNVPSYSVVDTTAIAIDGQYRMAILYYVVGNAQLRDDEEDQDQRGGTFITRFTSQLLSLQS